MKYSEIYTSIQGEGKYTGVPSVFFRTSYCNIRCSWCDTPFTSWAPENKDISVDDAVDQILSYDPYHLVITGGEPFVWGKELQRLCSILSDEHSKCITIETNATIFEDVDVDLISMSPKLSSSTPWERDPKWAKKHERDRINIDVINQFLDTSGPGWHKCQLKFVIVDGSEMDEIKNLLKQLRHSRADIYLMPEGITKDQIEQKQEMVIDLAMQHGFRYCDRLHTRVWGNKRAT